MGRMMTDEEAEALSDYFVEYPPKVDPSKRGGYFTERRRRLDAEAGVIEVAEPRVPIEGYGTPKG